MAAQQQPPPPPMRLAGEPMPVKIRLKSLLDSLFNAMSMMRQPTTFPRYLTTIPEHQNEMTRATVMLNNYEIVAPGVVIDTGGENGTTPVIIASAGVVLDPNQLSATIVQIAAQLMMIMDHNIGLVVGIGNRSGMDEQDAASPDYRTPNHEYTSRYLPYTARRELRIASDGHWMEEVDSASAPPKRRLFSTLAQQRIAIERPSPPVSSSTFPGSLTPAALQLPRTPSPYQAQFLSSHVVLHHGEPVMLVVNIVPGTEAFIRGHNNLVERTVRIRMYAMSDEQFENPLKVHEFTHIEVNNWSVNQVLPVGELVTLMSRLLELQMEPLHGPGRSPTNRTVIHCSNGYGRTGVVLSLLAAFLPSQVGRYPIDTIISMLRQLRFLSVNTVQLVNTADQFALVCYLAIFAVCGEWHNLVNPYDFMKYVSWLRTITSSTVKRIADIARQVPHALPYNYIQFSMIDMPAGIAVRTHNGVYSMDSFGRLIVDDSRTPIDLALPDISPNYYVENQPVALRPVVPSVAVQGGTLSRPTTSLFQTAPLSTHTLPTPVEQFYINEPRPQRPQVRRSVGSIFIGQRPSAAATMASSSSGGVEFRGPSPSSAFQYASPSSGFTPSPPSAASFQRPPSHPLAQGPPQRPHPLEMGGFPAASSSQFGEMHTPSPYGLRTSLATAPSRLTSYQPPSRLITMPPSPSYFGTTAAATSPFDPLLRVAAKEEEEEKERLLSEEERQRRRGRRPTTAATITQRRQTSAAAKRYAEEEEEEEVLPEEEEEYDPRQEYVRRRRRTTTQRRRASAAKEEEELRRTSSSQRRRQESKKRKPTSSIQTPTESTARVMRLVSTTPRRRISSIRPQQAQTAGPIARAMRGQRPSSILQRRFSSSSEEEEMPYETSSEYEPSTVSSSSSEYEEEPLPKRRYTSSKK
jgi:hypothetical protein